MEPTDAIPAIPLWLDLTAVAFGALSASATAENVQSRGRRIDWLGIAILGIAVGLGGGFLRDLLIGVPFATIGSNWYILTAASAALIGMWLSHALQKVNALVTILDAASLGFFAVVGTAKAIAHGIDPLPAIMIGTVAAAGGGAIRDLLVQLPVGVLFAGTFYAAAAFIGTAAFVVADLLGSSMITGMLICWVITVGIRLASVKWGLSLPEQMSLRRSESRQRRDQRRLLDWWPVKRRHLRASTHEPATYTGSLPIIDKRRGDEDAQPTA